MHSGRRMKILMTTSTFPFRQGDGQARFILDLAMALSTTATVTVISPHAPGSPTHETIDGVTVRRFRYFIPVSLQRLAYGAGMRHNLDRSWLARAQVPCLMAAQVLAQSWSVVRDRPSVINAHWLIPQGLTAAVVARIFRVPLVVHVHAADVYFLQRLRFGPALARFVVQTSATILADGSHVHDALDALIGGESGARLRPMGVWVRHFQGREGNRSPSDDLPPRFVAFVGRLVEKKGVEYLIRAMVSIREQEPGLELVVVGDGPLEIQLMELSRELGLEPFIHFMGYRGHEDVAFLLRESDVACVPSVIDSKGETDGMPTVVLEAMAAGARVVGSAVDGIPDVLRDTENGWLVEPADPSSLAEGILSALSSGQGDAISAAGVLTAEEHDWPAVAREYQRVLGEAARA